MRGSIFDTPGRMAISSEMAGAAMRGSRHASGRCRLEPSGSSCCEDRGFSRSGRGFVPCRTSPRQSLDSYFPPTIRRGPVRLVQIAGAAGEAGRDEELLWNGLPAPTKICLLTKSKCRNWHRAAVQWRAVRLWKQALAGKGDGSRLVTVRSHAIHPVHDEIRRQAAWSDQDHSVRGPWTRLFGATTGRMAEPPAPRKSVGDRTPFRGQLRKDNPHLCRKSEVAPFNRAGTVRAP